MNKDKLKQEWQKIVENTATIKGWDFSMLNMESAPHIWKDWRTLLKELIKPTDRIVDMGTAAGERLLALKHPHKLCAATEGYKPNVELAAKKLIPLGIDFKETSTEGGLPFKDNYFNVIINRHDYFDAKLLYKKLKKNGLFITEQVCGSDFYKELHTTVAPKKFKGIYNGMLETDIKSLSGTGLKIITKGEDFHEVRFKDMKSVLIYLKWIDHTLPYKLDVDKYFDGLYKVHEIIKKQGYFSATAHLYRLIAQKA